MARPTGIWRRHNASSRIVQIMVDEEDEFYEPVTPRSGIRRGVLIVVVVIVVAAMIVLAASSGRRPAPDRADPTPATDVGRIAIVGADGSLLTMDSRGAGRTQLSVPGVAFQFPAWSPDGSRLAVLGGGGIYVLDAAANGPTEPQIAPEGPNEVPFYLFWAPDSQRVAFISGGSTLTLRIAPADASAAATTVREGAPMYWDWTGPETLLIHSGGAGAAAFLGETGPDGADRETTALVPGYFRAPAVTADGRYRAFVIGADGVDEGAVDGEVIVEERGVLGNRHATRVFGVTALGFDPAGDSLAFLGPDRPSRRVPALPVGPLRIMDPGTGDVRTILDGQVFAFFWSPDGATIAALRGEIPGGGGVASAGPADVAASVVLGLAFVDVATGRVRSERAARFGDLFADQLLPFFDQYALSHRLWSPDSASIALPLVDDNDVSRIVIIPADGSPTRTLADGVIGFWSP
jgi:TolB protein